MGPELPAKRCFFHKVGDVGVSQALQTHDAEERVSAVSD